MFSSTNKLGKKMGKNCRTNLGKLGTHLSQQTGDKIGEKIGDTLEPINWGKNLGKIRDTLEPIFPPRSL